MDSTANAAVQIGQYRLLTTLGIGAFGKVKRELLSICSPNKHTVGSCLLVQPCVDTSACLNTLIWVLSITMQ
jgi:hypothetical protein